MSVFLFSLCVVFFSFFSKCFSNFLLLRLTFTFNFCPLLLLTTKVLTTVTFTNLFLHARLLLLSINCIVLYCIIRNVRYKPIMAMPFISVGHATQGIMGKRWQNVKKDIRK